MRLALLLALLLPLAACDALSDAVDETACQASGYADAGRVSATVSGDAFSGTCVRVDRQQGALSIVGADNVVSQNNQEVITLTFPSTELRSYALGAEVAAATFTRRTEDSDDQAREVYVGLSGTVTLTAFSDDAAEGTFSFTAENEAGDEVTVSGGTFDVTF